MTVLNKPSMQEVVELEGVEVIKGKIKCVSHSPDNHPSLKIYDDHGHCFACGYHCDSIKFIQDYHGLSFSDALSYLGIKKNSRPVRPDPVKTRVRELKKLFYQWTHERCLYLADMLRWIDEAKALCRDMTDLVNLAELYHGATALELEFHILMSNDENAKFDLFIEADGKDSRRAA